MKLSRSCPTPHQHPFLSLPGSVQRVGPGQVVRCTAQSRASTMGAQMTVSRRKHQKATPGPSVWQPGRTMGEWRGDWDFVEGEKP